MLSIQPLSLKLNWCREKNVNHFLKRFCRIKTSIDSQFVLGVEFLQVGATNFYSLLTLFQLLYCELTGDNNREKPERRSTPRTEIKRGTY